MYLNWIYADGGNDFVLTGEMSETKNYGDAQYGIPLDIGDGSLLRRDEDHPNQIQG